MNRNQTKIRITTYGQNEDKGEEHHQLLFIRKTNKKDEILSTADP